MAIGNQLKFVKQYWLLILIAAIFLMFTNNQSISQGYGSLSNGVFSEKAFDSIAQSGYAPVTTRAYGVPAPADDFAPDEENRKITKTASMSQGIKRGQFFSSESRLLQSVNDHGGLVINVNTWENGPVGAKYKSGSYNIKVESDKYGSLVEQMKQIGEVKSFNENSEDVTGNQISLTEQIEAEKSRLDRYNEIYDREGVKVEELLQLTDRIFTQERKILYLENSLNNLEQRVDYSSISMTLSEDSSEWTGIAIVKISKLAKNLVASVNSLLNLLTLILPYAIVAGLGYLGYRRFRKHQ